MCTMDVHPKARSVDQFQAMAHNVATDLGNVQMLLPILQVREPEDVINLVRAQRLLSKAYTELLNLYAKYVPQHTAPGNHEGSPGHTHPVGNEAVRVLTSPEPLPDHGTLVVDLPGPYQGYDDAPDVGYVNTP